MTQQHLWLSKLHPELVSVFATAFTLSSKKRDCRVSTERFLAALPHKYKEQMMALCRAAQSEVKMTVREEDLPAPALPEEWQEKICFSTCIESTLHRCTADRTTIVEFLKLLSMTAVRLHCIIDRNLIDSIDSYLTADTDALPLLCETSRVAPCDRWHSHAPAATMSFDDDQLASEDILHLIMASTNSIETLRKCKAVCTAWRQAARRTLSDVDWLLANRLGLHDLLKKGRPSPELVLALVAKRGPECVTERDGEGLLPLQYAAAYRMDAMVVAAIRQATVVRVPSTAAWANSAEARYVKSHLRLVRTRVVHGPIHVA